MPAARLPGRLMLLALVVLLRQFCKSDMPLFRTCLCLPGPKGATKKRTSGIGSEVQQPTSGVLPENHNPRRKDCGRRLGNHIAVASSLALTSRRERVAGFGYPR